MFKITDIFYVIDPYSVDCVEYRDTWNSITFSYDKEEKAVTATKKEYDDLVQRLNALYT